MADPSPLSDLPMPRSVWTLDTLYLWVKERIDRVEEGTKLQLTSAKEAVGAAKVENDLRLQGMNEFRQSINDRNAAFAQKGEVDTKIGALEARLYIIEKRTDQATDKSAGAAMMWAAIIGVLVVIGQAVTVFISLRGSAGK